MLISVSPLDQSGPYDRLKSCSSGSETSNFCIYSNSDKVYYPAGDYHDDDGPWDTYNLYEGQGLQYKVE